MKNSKIMYSLLLCLFLSMFHQACTDEKTTPELVVMTESLDFVKDGETKGLLVKSTGNWMASVSDTWIAVEPASGGAETSKVLITVEQNAGETRREGSVTFSLGNLRQTTQITQLGQGAEVPNNNEGMVNNAKDLAAKMKVGWNLGNSLESTSATSADETMWGNPKTSKRLIDAVKAAGFNAVRIPCAWSGYIENQETYKISDEWLARVKEVVDYCVDNEMYTILNIHWDGGWLEENPYYSCQEAVNKKQQALWTQIATYFKDYGEYLLFAGTNEVHGQSGTPSAENIAVQLSYNQTFVDAVRDTGGKNSWRNLIVQAYNTNIDYALKYMKMPEDKVANRLMMEIHYYDPYDFTLQETPGFKTQWGKPFLGGNVSTWGQEAWADEIYGKLKTNFVNKGIPVILGEYGAILRSKLPSGLDEHIQARNYYLNYITQTARENGCIPFYWDNGNTGNNGFGLFNRSTGAQVYPDAIQSIVSN